MLNCSFCSGSDLRVLTSILSRLLQIRVRWHALDHSYRSTEEPNDLISDMGRRRSHVDRQWVFAWIWFFERIDLAL